MNIEICEVCKKPIEECICCPECGHICSLDSGELHCPVCFPEKKFNDEYFMDIAIKEAEAAFMEGEVPIGAVIVKDNTIIAKAHNIKESRNDPTAHAELILLREATSQIKNWRLTDAALYVTKEPCLMCAGAMVNARLGKLVYGCEDAKGGAVHSLYQVLSDKRLNHQVKVVSGVLEDKCAELLKNFFQKRR